MNRSGAAKKIVIILLGCLAFMGPVPATAASVPDRNETVILLHGVLGHPVMMKKIEWTLERAGYTVMNIGYASRGKMVEEAAADLAEQVRSLNSSSKIHFVGFSLGSIIIRYYLSHTPPENAGRFVMIAPPNHGSELADTLYPYGWFRFLYGDKAITQLLASNRAFYSEVGIPTVPFGIIAGGLCNGKGLSRNLPGDDDGSVSLQSARLEGAADFFIIRGQHTGLLLEQETADQVVSFLASGQFDHRGEIPCDAGQENQNLP
jgi:pimeloyl-ACP methyl ester carboxylesterase